MKAPLEKSSGAFFIVGVYGSLLFVPNTLKMVLVSCSRSARLESEYGRTGLKYELE